jgi:fructan beta-fructosidase
MSSVKRIAAPLLCVSFLFAAGLYQEPYRPQFHFTPQRNWMNDPNGLVFYKGEYHLFYQFNPFGEKWGHMSWGHAVSRDLLHWQNLPVALREENGIMVFSGSAVVDARNTSGLCKSSDPNDPSCLIAIYTGHRTDGTLQTQNIASSNDRGRTWTKYAGNPVIDLHKKDFRDPKVFWYASGAYWVMAAVLPDEHKVRFFRSPDLKQWTALSDFGPAGATGGVWECPDLFALPIDGDPLRTRWVLIVNLNPGGLRGGSGAQYFTGQFDGQRFLSDSPPDKTFWVDYGADFYAVSSYNNVPGGRSIWIGWVSNWLYGQDEPTSPWRTMQSIPRELGLKQTPDGLRLVQRPIAEMKTLRANALELPAPSGVEEANRFLARHHAGGDTLEVLAEIDPGDASEAGFRVRIGGAESTLVGIAREPRSLFIDRTHSGQSSFHAAFPARHAAPLSARTTHTLHFFIDRSSVELFGDDGTAVITDRIYPAPQSNGIELYASGGAARIVSLRLWTLRHAVLR